MLRNPEPVLYASGERVIVQRRRRGKMHGEVESIANSHDGRARYWVRLDSGIKVFVTSNEKLCREHPLEALARMYEEAGR